MKSQSGELTYLRAAIIASKQEGLFQEFSSLYRSYRSHGDNVFKAAWQALYDWDILDVSEMNKDGSVSLELKMDPVKKGKRG